MPVNTAVPAAPLLPVATRSRAQWLPKQPLTAVISAFERPKRLENCLRSFFAHYPDWFCVVADVSRQPLQLDFDHPNLKMVRPWSERQIGNLSAARNLALAEVYTPHFALLDDDLILASSETLGELYRECVTRHAQVCAGDVQQDGRHNRFEGLFREEFGGLRVFPVAGADPVRVHAFKNFFVGETAFCRRVGWDAGFPIQEHLDFLIRFQRAGGEAWFCQGAIADHDRGAETADYEDFRRRDGFHAKTLAKHDLDWVAYANGNVLRDDQFEPGAESTCVLVLTTGRSGSSCVAAVLDRLGCSMGDQLARPHPGEAHVNPTYHEPLDLLPAGWAWSGVTAGDWAFERVRDHVSRMRLRSALFGIKLPGFAHQPELAAAAVGGGGAGRIKYVYAARDPEASAQSLRKTGWQSDIIKAREHLAVRRQSIESFLGGVSAEDRTVVQFEDLLEHPEREITRLAEFIGADLDRVPEAVGVVNHG